MIEYFRSIGFDKLDGEQVKWLEDEVKENPDNRYAWCGDSPDILWEHFKYYGENMGILVRGKTDEQEKDTAESCIPVYMPELKIKCDTIRVENSGNDYTVSYEMGGPDNRMSFSLQNVVDYIKNKELSVNEISIVGLSLGGTILLPVAKKDDTDGSEENIFYRELLQKARTGNNLAQQILNVKVQRTTDSIRDRLYKEDILSIIEGFLIPSEEECRYFVMGNIVSIKMFKNHGTSERVYRLALSVAGTELDVVVSGSSLAGMPMVGMRFLGGCWLQGRLNFR